MKAALAGRIYSAHDPRVQTLAESTAQMMTYASAWVNEIVDIADDYEHVFSMLGTIATLFTAWVALRTVREMREDRRQASRPFLQLAVPDRTFMCALTRRGILIAGQRGPRPTLFSIRNDGPGAAFEIDLEFSVDGYKTSDRQTPRPKVVEWDLQNRAGPLQGVLIGRVIWRYLWKTSTGPPSWISGSAPRVEWDHIPIIPSGGVIGVKLTRDFIARASANCIAEAIVLRDGHGFIGIKVTANYKSGAGERRKLEEVVSLNVVKVRPKLSVVKFLAEVKNHQGSSSRMRAEFRYAAREEEVGESPVERIMLRCRRKSREFYSRLRFKFFPPEAIRRARRARRS